jgi:hypothetical protein
LITGLFWLMTAVCAMLPAGLWIAAPLPLVTLLVPTVNAVVFAHQAAVTPDRLHGRVVRVLVFLSTLANPIAPLLASVLFEYVNPAVVLATVASCLSIAADVAVLSPGGRGMRHVKDEAAT